MERCFFYCIDDDESWQRGAAGSRRWSGMLDARRKVVLFGAMAALMEGLARFLHRSLQKMVWRMTVAATSECAHKVYTAGLLDRSRFAVGRIGGGNRIR